MEGVCIKVSTILLVLFLIGCIVLVCFLPEFHIERPDRTICFSGTVSEYSTDNSRKVLVHVVDPGDLHMLTDAIDVFVVIPETYTTLPAIGETVMFVCPNVIDETSPPILYAKSVSIEMGTSGEDRNSASTSSKAETPAGSGGEYIMSIVYDGELYRGMIYYMQIALDVEYVGKISSITDSPTKELECTMGEVGQNVYVFEYNGRTCLLVEREKDDLEEGCVFGAVVGLKAGEVSEITNNQYKWRGNK